MDCERARDRYSSFWEKELTSLEEKEVREHLSSCPECRKEFEQFEKTMQWLHSVEEVEVPDGFLPGLYKRMEERRAKTPTGKRSAREWFSLQTSLKLPVQAAAMVAIVFLVLYLAKMMPTGVHHPKETKQTSALPTPAEKAEKMLEHKERNEEPKISERPAETPRLKDHGQVEPSAPAKERMDAFPPQMRAEAKKEEVPSPENTIIARRAFDLREQEKPKSPSAEPEGTGKGLAGLEKSVVASKPFREIVLKISDREKAVSRLQELLTQFGGEVVTTEGNMFVASLPTGSFSEFEKEVAGLGSSANQDKLIREKQAAGNLRAVPQAKKKEAPKPAVDAEDRTTVRILLVEE
jgi:hypothetical protein